MRLRRQIGWVLVLGFLGYAQAPPGAAQQVAATPTLVLYNGRVLTLDAHFTTAEAVAIRGHRTQAVGSSAQILKLAGPGTRKIDLSGRVLLPGFSDSHFHLSSAAERTEKAQTREQQFQALPKVIHALHAAGITSVYEGWATPEEIRLLQDLRDAGKLNLRVGLRVGVRTMEDYQATRAMPRTGFGDAWLRIGNIKIRVDGSGEEGLFTEAHRSKPDYFGKQMIPTETLREMILQGNREGWGFSFHCNGDKAIDLILSILDEANSQKSIVGRRWTIEHARYVRPDQMQHIKKLGLWLSVQAKPYWMSAADIAELGMDRAAYGDPLRELIEAGVPLAGGSDDVTNFAPLLHAWWYVTRQTRESGVLGASHAITPREALLIETRYPPYLTFEEALKGTIEPEKFADFVVLDADPLQAAPSAIRDIRVVATIVGGTVVYGSL